MKSKKWQIKYIKKNCLNGFPSWINNISLFFSFIFLFACLLIDSLIPNLDEIYCNGFLNQGTFSLYRLEDVESHESLISLSKKSKPSYFEVSHLLTFFDYGLCGNDYSSILDSFMILNNYGIVNNITFESCFPATINSSIINGNKLNEFHLEDIVVNSQLMTTFPDYEIGTIITFEKEITFSTQYNEENIDDSLIIKIDFRIIGVAEETSLFNSPRIYYSQSAADLFFSNINLENYELQTSKKLNVYEAILQGIAVRKMETYCWKIGFAEHKEVLKMRKIISNTDYEISSTMIDAQETINPIFSACSIVAKIILTISILCMLISIGMYCLVLFENKKKDIGIFISYGLTQHKISMLFTFPFVYKGIFTWIIALPFSIISSLIIKKTFYTFFMINFDATVIYKSTMSFTLISLLMCLLMCITSYITASFIQKKRICMLLKEEID